MNIQPFSALADILIDESRDFDALNDQENEEDDMDEILRRYERYENENSNENYDDDFDSESMAISVPKIVTSNIKNDVDNSANQHIDPKAIVIQKYLALSTDNITNVFSENNNIENDIENLSPLPSYMDNLRENEHDASNVVDKSSPSSNLGEIFTEYDAYKTDNNTSTFGKSNARVTLNQYIVVKPEILADGISQKYFSKVVAVSPSSLPVKDTVTRKGQNMNVPKRSNHQKGLSSDDLETLTKAKTLLDKIETQQQSYGVNKMLPRRAVPIPNISLGTGREVADESDMARVGVEEGVITSNVNKISPEYKGKMIRFYKETISKTVPPSQSPSPPSQSQDKDIDKGVRVGVGVRPQVAMAMEGQERNPDYHSSPNQPNSNSTLNQPVGRVKEKTVSKQNKKVSRGGGARRR